MVAQNRITPIKRMAISFSGSQFLHCFFGGLHLVFTNFGYDEIGKRKTALRNRYMKAPHDVVLESARRSVLRFIVGLDPRLTESSLIDTYYFQPFM